MAFYRPESEPFENIEFVAKIDPFIFTNTISTEPVEPNQIMFEHDLYSINKSSALNISTLLKSANGKVSSNLDVNFTYRTQGSNTALINLTPGIAKTIQTDTEPFTKALATVQNISEIRDTIWVMANYNTLVDSTMIIFTD